LPRLQGWNRFIGQQIDFHAHEEYPLLKRNDFREIPRVICSSKTGAFGTAPVFSRNSLARARDNGASPVLTS
jgi:hypothetical protein